MGSTERTLITGASSGLGEGTARELAARGHALALCARRAERLDDLASSLRAAGATVATASLDVTDHDAVAPAFRALRDELGGLDRVVVNAGVGRGEPVGTGKAATNLGIVATNSVAALVQCEASLEIFRAQGHGHLVVISSVAAERGLRGTHTAYAASKAALSSLAEGIRADVADTPIRVTTISPGYVHTEMNAGLSRPLAIDAEAACRLIAGAIERAPAQAYVPDWPWALVAPALRAMPSALLRRLG